MQQTRDIDNIIFQELFKEELPNAKEAEAQKKLQKKMDKRLKELEAKGHTLDKRVILTERQYDRATMSKTQRKKKRKAQKLARKKNR